MSCSYAFYSKMKFQHSINIVNCFHVYFHEVSTLCGHHHRIYEFVGISNFMLFVDKQTFDAPLKFRSPVYICTYCWYFVDKNMETIDNNYGKLIGIQISP